MNGIRLGTSAFTAAGWPGTFYPKGMKPAGYLTYYATKFDTVEVDSTFYRMPSISTVNGWARALAASLANPIASVGTRAAISKMLFARSATEVDGGVPIVDLSVDLKLTLSDSQELLLRLHWVALLYGRLKANLALTGGVHTAEDVLKAIMAGANVAMMTSALLRHGIEHAELVLGQLTRWMEEHEYESIRQMRGSMSYLSTSRPDVSERVNYMKVLSSYSLR